MKLNSSTWVGPLILSILFTASFCAAQDSNQPQLASARQSTSEPAAVSSSGQTSSGQTGSGQSTAPANAQDGQPAQPAAQTPAQTPAPGQTQKKTETEDDKNGQAPGNATSGNTASGTASGTSSGTSKDRLFFALPNFLTVENAGNVPPLTAGQKFKVVAWGSFDPIQIVWYAALSGICQAENCEPGFKQGWTAYAKRYGAYAADGTIENFFVGAIFPSVLHQDPRFFPKAQGSFFNRTEYAVSRIFVTRTDSGRHQFNYSEIFGAAMASAISTYSYHPRRTLIGETVSPTGVVTLDYAASERTLKNTASVWGSQVGYDTITLVIKQFWPDIRRKVKKK